MTIDNLLMCLGKVKRTGSNKWLACCPAHDDKHPSLSIAEAEDGRVLLHCWAGCHTSDVLASIGLTFGDLYPAPSHAHLLPVRKPFNASDVLTALAFEITFAWNCASMMATGERLPDSDRARLLVCANRMNAAMEVLNA